MAELEKLQTLIAERFSETANIFVQHQQIILEIDPSDLLLCCKILRDEDEFRFEQLLDVCGVDYLHYGISEWATDSATSEGFSRGRYISSNTSVLSPPSKGAELHSSGGGCSRFAVVYQLLSLSNNQRLRLRVYARDEPPTVPSVVKIWPAANWYEREAFDLFGIHFEDHPDLRRILTDYGFVGHPFRKDFPLIGHVEMRYDAQQGKCIYEPVSIEARTLVPKVIRHVEKEHG